MTALRPFFGARRPDFYALKLSAGSRALLAPEL